MTKFSSQFLLDKEKDKPDAKIRFRIRWDKNILSFNIGYRVDIDKWSKDAQRCKVNTTHGKRKVMASVINGRINDFEEAYQKTVAYFQNLNISPNIDDFKSVINKHLGKESGCNKVTAIGFYDVYDLFVKEEGKKNVWSSSTNQKMETQKNHLKVFDSDLSFEDINESKLIDYQYFLQDVVKMQNSTILKQFSFLRWFLKWAYRKGYIKQQLYEEFRPKLKTTQKKIIFLSQTELKQLIEYSIPECKKYLERVRDIFLFQCFTGLRYSDVYNLKKNDIKDNYIEITTIKTNDSLIIELNNKSREILEKYADFEDKSNRALPVVSNQKMNNYIKELAELAELDEPVRETYYKGNKRIDTVTPKYALLSSHAGRRTFICNALSLGIPPQVVMKWTGHSDYKAMKPYIDIANETKKSAMSKFDELL